MKYGEKVHISCVVNAIPPATEIYWEKELNGIKNVINTGTTGTEGITVANPALILIHATDSDAGLYKCFAVNEFGMGYSSAIKLNVIGGNIFSTCINKTSAFNLKFIGLIYFNRYCNVIY